jgi:hypothetical protein
LAGGEGVVGSIPITPINLTSPMFI